MPNLMEQRATWLSEQQKLHCSRAVTYARGTDSVSIDAMLGRSMFEMNTDAGPVIRAESVDFTFEAADLVIDGVAAEPAQGDTITDGTRKYEVLAPTGEAVWRWSDSEHVRMRVHTKEVAA